MKFHKTLTAISALALTTALGSFAAQADYPEKPIKIYVGFSAGGGTDTTARAFASFLHESEGMNGMPAVVVNKPGGTGMIAAKIVKESRPDGYTLYMINSGTFSITDMKSFGKAPVKPLEDFQIIGCMSQLVTALQVPIASPIKSAADFAQWAKDNNGKIKWGNSGRGSMHTLAGMLFLKRMGIKSQDIPFKGGSGARNALAAEKVDFAFNGIHMAAGFGSKIRVLGVTSSERDKVHPKVPTLGEANMPNLGIVGPMCLWGAKDLPAEVVTKLGAAIKHVAGLKGYARLMKKQGLLAIHRSADEGTAATKKLYTELRPVVEEVFAKK
ncbi:MAG: Bug family tripartite tricarboxylate transporter substrate binding protein [Methyloligellaceae bacterium]